MVVYLLFVNNRQKFLGGSMLKYLLGCLLALHTWGFSEMSFKIQPHSYLFSSNYDIFSGDAYQNTIENQYLQLQTIYSLYDAHRPVASGCARLFSMGVLSNCMRESDVTDDYGAYIGMIEGKWWTTSAGKYLIYDKKQRHVATAYVDRAKAGVSIVDARNERIPFALMRRSYVPNGDYFWEVKVIHEDAIDLRILKIFSAFITDAFWPSQPSSSTATWEAIQTMVIVNSIINASNE
jgi:hypothetical protein